MADYMMIAVDWLKEHPYWAALAIFLINLSESLVVIGLFVPGTLVMFGIGTLVALGAIDLWQTLGWAVVGAIVGDGISYLIGRRYRESLRTWWPFNHHPDWFDRAEVFFQRHGGKSVVFGRFAGPVRPIIPAIAGMMGMPAGRFYWVNFLSAITWAPAYILPGVALGASLTLASQVGTRLMVLLALVFLLIWLTIVLVKRVYGLLQPRTARMVLRLLDWGQAHPRFQGMTAGLLDPDHPETKALVELGGVLLVGGAIFFLALVGELGHPDPHSIDYQAYLLFQDLRTSWADQLMVFIAQLADTPVNIAVIGGVLGWLVVRRRWLAAAHWLAAVAVASLAATGLNYLLPVSHPRPELLTGPMSYAFPSTHGVVVSALYGFLAVLVARELPPSLRRLPYSIAGLWITLVVLAHLYLGRHWVSDVAAGVMLGLAWCCLVGIAYRRHAHEDLSLPGLLVVLVVALSLAGGWQVTRHAKEVERYSLQHPQRHLTTAEWWSGQWASFPGYLLDWEGAPASPMNVQYAGDLAELARHLEPYGWREPAPLDSTGLLQLLAPTPELLNLPVLPHTHQGRQESLTLVRCHASSEGSGVSRLVLRLWPADGQLTNGAPLWLGSVSREHLTAALGLMTVPVTDQDHDLPGAVLDSALAGLVWKTVVRRDGPTGRHNTVRLIERRN